ncbi:MAG: arginase [Gammaproteobacteria bacterium]
MIADFGYKDAPAASRAAGAKATVPRVAIIGAACGLGATDRGCASGPDALRRLGLARVLHNGQHKAIWRATVRPRRTPTHAEEWLAVQALCRDLAQHVSATVRNGERFAVVGGDHGCAIGTWSGAYDAIRERGRLGLVWIDAHMDSHTPATSPSGAVHGMPLAALLGHGHPTLTDLLFSRAKLLPEHICLLGVRSFERGEAQLLERLGTRVILMDEIRARGLGCAFDEALRIARKNTAGFGITIDLDAIDPMDAPGVGSPAPDGLRGRDLIECLRRVADHATLLGIEVAELNPTRDRQRRTVLLARDLLQAGLTGRIRIDRAATLTGAKG